MKKTLLFLSFFPLIFGSYLEITNRWSQKAITEDCLEKSHRHDCSVFNRCCEFRCHQFTGKTSKSHFCMALLGQIVEDRTECACSSAVSLRSTNGKSFLQKFDLLAGVILIFVIDIVLIAFSI